MALIEKCGAGPNLHLSMVTGVSKDLNRRIVRDLASLETIYSLATLCQMSGPNSTVSKQGSFTLQIKAVTWARR